MASDNKQYKDRLFHFLFGSEENKEWTLSLYNAVNETDYDDPSLIEINTIKEIMYLGMRNDVSFLIAEEMSLYEQQSTFNPNMPLRLLQYAGNLYEKYVKQNKLNKYSGTVLKLPVPKLVAFYNGTQEQPDEMMLNLSDSFSEDTDPDIEVKVRMLNVNYGRSGKLLNACEPLKEYAWLVEQVRMNIVSNGEEGMSSAVDKAISAMPADFLIKPFLEAHRSEVKGMLLTEYNEAEQMELFKEDGRREGIQIGMEKGMEKGMFKTLFSLVRRGELSVKVAAVQAGISETAFRREMEKFK